MIGNAAPNRFSRRIKEKASLSPIRVSSKRKIRKSVVNKRICGVNSSFLTTKLKTKGGGKNKAEDSPMQVSKYLKRASPNSKFVTRKSSRISIPKICDKKRKTRSSLKTSQINLTNNKVTLKNLEMFNNKKVIENENCKKFVNEEKQSARRSLGKENSKKFVNEEKQSARRSFQKENCKKFVNEEKQSAGRSLRLSKSLPEEKGKNKELNDSALKPSKRGRPRGKKSTRQATTLSSKSVLTPNSEKCTHTSKHSGRKKSARLSIEPLNKEISTPSSASKSLIATPVPGKVTQLSRHSGNRKSGRLSKEPDRLRKMNSDISLNTSSFYSLLETPQPEKHSEKRKSSRLLEPSPLRTLNKELSLSTPASLLISYPDSILNKSSESCKGVELSSSKSRSRKQSRSKESIKDGSTVSHKKQKQKRQVSQNQKTSGNFKKPLSNETENFPLVIHATPHFKPPHGRNRSKKYLSKSDSKSSKRNLNTSASEELRDAKRRKTSAVISRMPAKGTLKHKRWLLNNLKEKNGSYEDDIFENKNFDLYKTAFHFGDESDGSSVNIATPKFDCILTPSLPKKTPRFKDCISPTEFLQVRKTAEEYLYRRNKKRKSGDRPSSSGKKTVVNKKNAVQDIPEKKKLDYDDAVNKLIAVQKNLEIEAEVHDEEEDTYFSDASN